MKPKKLTRIVVCVAVVLAILEMVYVKTDKVDIPMNDHITSSGAE